ncbi:VTT domain-containing protein [Candidatus Microgenomates bacterium]|nr:VTT domain-containing protein [Candidatus Microgenomates bacterium]
MKKEKLTKYGFIVLSLLISGGIIYFRNDLANLKEFGLLGIFFISILGNATIVIPAPVVVTAFVGGSVFNPYLVGVITAAGATIGELTGFLAGHGGTAVVKETKKYKKIKKWMHKSGFLTISVLAAIPNPLFDLAGIISGVTKYPLYKFLTATFIGKTIKFVTIAVIGSLAF